MLERVRRVGLDALGVLAAVVYALPSLDYPFGMDQPIHWYIGRRWLEGELPYVSGISTKPPGAFAVHAASIALFGDHQRSVRLVDLFFVLLAGALIATFRTRRTRNGEARDATPRRPGEIGAACLAVAAIAYGFFDWNALGHPDLWQGVFSLMAAWVLVRAPDGVVGPRRALAAGALACVAVTFKHVACVSGVAFGAVVVVLALHRRAPRDAWIGALAFTGGVVLVLALVLLPFALTSTLPAFWEVMVDLILRYAAAGADADPVADAWPSLAHGLAAIVVPFAAACLGVLHAMRRADRPSVATGVIALLTMLCALGAVVVQGRSRLPSFLYYWLALVPTLGLGLAIGARMLAVDRPAISFAVIVALALVSFVTAPGWLSTQGHSYRAEWAAFATSAPARGEAYVGHHPALDNYPRQAAVAARIRARRRTGDTLCVYGYFGATYQLTGLRCPSRFVVPPEAMEGSLPAWRDEYARMWRDDPPTFVVTTSAREGLIEARVREGYRREDVLDGRRPHFVILERRRSERVTRYSM